MAKFDSQYPVQISPEMGDKILIAAAQDGSIMALPFSAVMAYIQKYLNEIDDELSATSLHPVQNRVITQAINDILAQLQPVDDKEIISVLSYSSEVPESATEGDLFINSDTNELLEWADSDEWIPTEAKENVIYITNDTTHFYIYKDDAFVDMTNQPIDNTIYITSLNELDEYTDEGIYRVCLTASGANRSYTYYTFIVESAFYIRLRRVTHTQTLSNRSGYQSRYKHNTGPWSEWSNYEYFFRGNSAEYVQDETLNMAQNQVNSMILGRIEDLETQVRAAL